MPFLPQCSTSPVLSQLWWQPCCTSPLLHGARAHCTILSRNSRTTASPRVWDSTCGWFALVVEWRGSLLVWRSWEIAPLVLRTLVKVRADGHCFIFCARLSRFWFPRVFCVGVLSPELNCEAEGVISFYMAHLNIYLLWNLYYQFILVLSRTQKINIPSYLTDD